MRQGTVHFAGLNGLRAIAAFAVVFSHGFMELPSFGIAFDSNGLMLANYGVSIFFVLSGFLITYLLLEEKERGDINIRKFYIRRILRIWPLYYLYLAVALVVLFATQVPVNGGTLALYIFYAANVPFILGTGLPLINHYWSLGVEEQFYLFWPWVVKKGRKYLVPIIVFIILVLVSARIAVHFLIGPNTVFETTLTVTRFHCMLYGALGAVLYKERHALFLKLVDNYIVQACCWVVLAIAAIDKFHVASVIDDDLISFVALGLIIGQVQVKHRIINLDTPWLDFLGKISYGIYVIHPLVIFALYSCIPQMPLSSPFNIILVFATIITCTIILAWLSYRYFESYFLRLKSKYTVVKSSAVKPVATDQANDQ